MAKPKNYQEPQPIEARLVTKTSLPKPKEAIALLLLLWFSNGKPAQLTYGSKQGPSKEGGIYDETVSLAVERFAKNLDINLNGINLEDALRSNPLVTSQIESLNAAFELVWHLASFRFADGRTLGSERTGGMRYCKRIEFGSNVDYIDILASNDEGGFASVLLSWLTNGATPNDSNAEHSLVRTLTLFAEGAFFKTSKGNSGIVYTPNGIYEQLLTTNENVDIVDPGEEAQGPTRILKTAVNDQLNVFLSSAGNGAVAVRSGAESELSQYSARVRKGLELSNVHFEDDSTLHYVSHLSNIDEPRNLIFFGAPGTGKSYQLAQLAKKYFDERNVRRVTFHPDYTYAQFVGCYKPVTTARTVTDVDGHESDVSEINYDFVPGPFLETYIAAVQNPGTNYLLVVEEINRANPAAAFGDVFQLLDRDSDGRSEYEIAVPHEMREYLRVFLPEYATTAHIQDPEQLLSEQLRLKDEARRLSLPPNMFIWATMNSADQGVFPMDTAFKRRWDFRYMGIDEGSSEIAGCAVPVGKSRHMVSWDALRRGINRVLLEAGVNEDKLLGPFFISPSRLADAEGFTRIFKDKVLLYLFEDAAKTKSSKVFSHEGRATYSDVCKDFDDLGERAFRGMHELPSFSPADAGAVEEPDAVEVTGAVEEPLSDGAE